ncbi:MAG TPA: hypothetical protein VIV60_37540, partial [Polyangiaceae bacterium]
PILCTASGISMKVLGETLKGKLRELLLVRPVWGDVQTRHRLVAEYAIELFDDRYEYLVSLVQALRPYVNRTTIKQRLTEARLVGRLLDAESVADVVGKRAPAFYDAVADGWQWNSRYWEQRALAVVHLDPVSALRFAEQGVGIERHPMPLTTLARVQFAVADSRCYASFDDRRLVVSAIGNANTAIDLSRRSSRREAHAHDVAIRGASRFLEHAHGTISLRQWDGWQLMDGIVADLPRVKAKASAEKLRQMWFTARSRFGI